MADLLHELGERVKALGAEWTKLSVVGTFVLYLLGYLALRFHLTMLGLSTDLAVLDERYLFTGARFLVFLLSSVPKLLLVALLPAWLAWAVWRLLPPPRQQALRAWAGHPGRLAMFGIVFALLAIQMVMRQCFFLHDLLLGSGGQDAPDWLLELLRGGWAPLYLNALVALCVPTVLAFWVLRGQPAAPFLRGVLGLLMAIQLLLLPINYGHLVVDKSFARLNALGDKPLAPDQQAWLVWEGKDGMTFLLRRGAGRSLLTLPRSEVKRVEIVGVDELWSLLYPAAALATTGDQNQPQGR